MNDDTTSATIIKAVLQRPKMYTFGDGTFGAALSFLEGYYSGKLGGYMSGRVAAGKWNSSESKPRKYQEWFDFRDWLQRKNHGRFKNGALIFHAPYEDNALYFAELLELYEEFCRAPEEEQWGERV